MIPAVRHGTLLNLQGPNNADDRPRQHTLALQSSRLQATWLCSISPDPPWPHTPRANASDSRLRFKFSWQIARSYSISHPSHLPTMPLSLALTPRPKMFLRRPNRFLQVRVHEFVDRRAGQSKSEGSFASIARSVPMARHRTALTTARRAQTVRATNHVIHPALWTPHRILRPAENIQNQHPLQRVRCRTWHQQLEGAEECWPACSLSDQLPWYHVPRARRGSGVSCIHHDELGDSMGERRLVGLRIFAQRLLNFEGQLGSSFSSFTAKRPILRRGSPAHTDIRPYALPGHMTILLCRSHGGLRIAWFRVTDNIHV